jgi:hypothetical protein
MSEKFIFVTLINFKVWNNFIALIKRGLNVWVSAYRNNNNNHSLMRENVSY